MMITLHQKKLSFFHRLTAAMILLCFLGTTVIPSSFAQEVFLPTPGTMVHLSDAFNPPLLKGIKVYPDNPFRLDFILNNGESHPEHSEGSLQQESVKLVKYFLTAVTVPENDLWVNLSPYEKDRIIPNAFGVTEMGRDLLAQDYLLKQITASVIYPEEKIGKEFWAKVHAESQKRFDTTDIPIDTFNKVWIVPEKAVIYEKNDAAYVVETHLKVMLEEDYQALNSQRAVGLDAGAPSTAKKTLTPPNPLFKKEGELAEAPNKTPSLDKLNNREDATNKTPSLDKLNNREDATNKTTSLDKEGEGGVLTTNGLGSQVIREIVLPILEKEVNEGKNFAQLRQIYHSLILAIWFKDKIRQNIFGQAYVDHNKISGVDITDKTAKEKIWAQYVESFKKGAYNYIKEEVDPLTQETLPRKYFSGGAGFDQTRNKISKVTDLPNISPDDAASSTILTVDLDTSNGQIASSTASTESVASVLQTDSTSYKKFEEWISGIDSSRLERKILISETLENLLNQLINNPVEYVSQSSARILHMLITNKLINKEELQENKVVGVLLRVLNSNLSWHEYNKISNILTTLAINHLLTKTEESEIIKTLLDRLTSYSSGATRKATSDQFVILIENGFLSPEEAKKRNILKTLLDELTTNQDISAAKPIIDILTALTAAGLADKEEIIKDLDERGTVKTLLKNLITNQDNRIREVNENILNALLTNGFVTKKETTKNEIIKTLLRALNTADNSSAHILIINILTTLITTGLATKEELKNAKIAEILLREVDSRFTIQMCINLMTTLNKLIAYGLITKEKVKKDLEKNGFYENLFYQLLDNWDPTAHNVNTQVLTTLISDGIITKEEIEDKKIVKSLIDKFISDKDVRYIREFIVHMLNAFVENGFVSKEAVIRIIKEKELVRDLLNGIQTDLHWSDRGLNADAFTALITSGFITKEEMQEKQIVKIFLDMLITNPNKYARKSIINMLNAFINAGFAPRETMLKNIEEHEIFEKLLRNLFTDLHWADREKTENTIKALIDNNFIPKKETLPRAEIESAFKEIYHKDFPADVSFQHYLEILTMLKDEPALAYQIAAWSNKNLEELFSLFNSLKQGIALDVNYKPEKNKKYFLEEKIIKNYLNLLSNPNLFLARLREKIKATINDPSMKLCLLVYEFASVNAAKGLIEASGLNKENVIILYEKEIDASQAGKFFPGYVVEPYRGLNHSNVIHVEFHDFGTAQIIASDDLLLAPLPYAPFKFNLPQKISSERITAMKKSLNISPNRKIIVIGSPSEKEFEEFMQAYNSLYGNLDFIERPLIIVGFRQRKSDNELQLLSTLSGQSIAVRSNAASELPDIKNNNVLILNTTGELINMFALANLAIVGNDRNIFEPASQEVAILYFEGGWGNNYEAKNILIENEAAKTFSQETLAELINNSHTAAEIAKNGSRAVKIYQQEIRVKTDAFFLQIIGAKPQLRDIFVSSSPLDSIKTNQPPVKVSAPGGVDLTGEKIRRQLTTTGNSVEFKFTAEMINRVQNAPGFVPVIINIQPLLSLPMFLGLKENETLDVATAKK